MLPGTDSEDLLILDCVIPIGRSRRIVTDGRTADRQSDSRPVHSNSGHGPVKVAAGESGPQHRSQSGRCGAELQDMKKAANPAALRSSAGH